MAAKPTALLVIDVQRGLFARRTPIFGADRLLGTINSLVARAHRAEIPVIYVRHASKAVLPKGTQAWQLHSQLKPLKKDILLDKTHPSAFEGTHLANTLERGKITRLIVTGLVTHGCVRATTLDALKRGYEVVLIEDGHSNFHKQAARLIREWNAKLAAAGAKVRLARAVRL